MLGVVVVDGGKQGRQVSTVLCRCLSRKSNDRRNTSPVLSLLESPSPLIQGYLSRHGRETPDLWYSSSKSRLREHASGVEFR